MTPPAPDALRRFLRSRRALPAAVAVALLLPHLFASPRHVPPLGPPRVYSGDEPHFLLQIHSLLDDGDLDLANNYRAVHDGSDDAGTLFAGTLLDHHTNWVERDHVVYWGDVYFTDPAKWRPSPYDGSLQPTLRHPRHPPAIPHEFPHHPIGLPLLLLPILAPFRGSTLLEPVAILCAALITLAALLAFRRLLRRFTDDPVRVNFATVALFLGTPAWCYGRTLFAEPWLLCFAVAGWALFFDDRRARNALLAGLIFALGALLKAPFLLLAVPPAIALLVERRFARLALFVAPLAAATVAVLAINAHLFGSPFRTAYPWKQGNPLRGLAGLLFSVDHGLLAFAPIAIVALMAIPALYRNHRRETLVLVSGSLLYALVFANWKEWHGGYCYGPRYLVPILGFVALPLVAVPLERRTTRIAAAVLLALSILINARGALPYWSSWATHPLAPLFAGG